MSDSEFISFENNVIEASGNLILKSNNNVIDCNGCDLSNVKIDTSLLSGSGGNVSFNDVIIDGSLVITNGDITQINTVNLDISDNIIGLNRGGTANSSKTSGMLINYSGAPNVFFGYYDNSSCFVIAKTDTNHDDPSRDIVIQDHVDLHVGNTTIHKDNSNVALLVKTDPGSGGTGNNSMHHATIKCLGGDLGGANIIWGEEHAVGNFGGGIYYDASSAKTEFKRHTTNTLPDPNQLITETVFYYDHSSNDIHFGGNIYAGDASLNDVSINTLQVDGEASFNSDISMNNLYVSGDASFNSDVSIHKLYVSGDASFNSDVCMNNLYVSGDASFNSDVCMNNLYVSGDASFNQNVAVTGKFYVSGDASFNDVSINNLEVKKISGLDTSTFATLGGSLSLDFSCNDIEVSGNIFVSGDASFNSDVSIHKLYVSGDASFNDVSINALDVTNTCKASTFNATSDYRLKTIIQELDDFFSVAGLRPLKYLKSGKEDIGLLAHELQEVFPYLVSGEKDGAEMQSVNYIGLIGVLINDIKRLYKENALLKGDHALLKGRLDALEEKLNTI